VVALGTVDVPEDEPAVRLIVCPGKAWAATSVSSPVPTTAPASIQRLMRRIR
jgi:hypothetical protein